jgi:hypothetical protein
MPIHKCTIDGKSGWKYGDTGKCYTGPNAKEKAVSQAIAIGGGEPPINEKLQAMKDIIDKLMITKTSFDWDGTLSTSKGKELWNSTGGSKWIITARNINNISEILKWASDNNVPRSRVIATGSNPAKIQKVKDLGIERHWDDNPIVVSKLPGVGRKI